jgi:hypothetical protein
MVGQLILAFGVAGLAAQDELEVLWTFDTGG